MTRRKSPTAQFLRKATATALERRLVCGVQSLRCRVLVCDAVDTASLVMSIAFGKLIGVTTLFDFGKERCRKFFFPVVRPRPIQ